MAAVLEFNRTKERVVDHDEGSQLIKDLKSKNVTLYLVSSSAIADRFICIFDNIDNANNFFTLINPVVTIKQHDVPMTVEELSIFNGFELDFALDPNKHKLGTPISLALGLVEFYTSPSTELVEAYLAMLEHHKLIERGNIKEKT